VNRQITSLEIKLIKILGKSNHNSHLIVNQEYQSNKTQLLNHPEFRYKMTINPHLQNEELKLNHQEISQADYNQQKKLSRDFIT